jgi:hypothetical protein
VIFPYYFIMGREIDGTPEACYRQSGNQSSTLAPTNNEIVEEKFNDLIRPVKIP